MSGPITIVKSGYNVQSATGTNILLNSSYPFTKLDTQNIVSFQTISLLFSNEPPQPPSGAPFYTNTLVYQFPHGYNYIPSTWMEWQNQSPAIPPLPTSGNPATIFYAFGDDTAGATAYNATQGVITQGFSNVALVEYNNAGPIDTTTTAILYIEADITNVYIYLMKLTQATISGSVIPLYLAGTTLNIRVYVFTEPANNSTY